MAPPKKQTTKKPTKQDAQKELIKKLAIWGFVAVVIIAIVVMVMNAPREKNLVCSGGGSSSLTGFGSCRAE